MQLHNCNNSTCENFLLSVALIFKRGAISGVPLSSGWNIQINTKKCAKIIIHDYIYIGGGGGLDPIEYLVTTPVTLTPLNQSP